MSATTIMTAITITSYNKKELEHKLRIVKSDYVYEGYSFNGAQERRKDYTKPSRKWTRWSVVKPFMYELYNEKQQYIKEFYSEIDLYPKF